MTVVHQLVPNFAAGDAIGLHVQNAQKALRAAGFTSEIFYDEVQASVRRLGRPYRELEPTPDTLLLYHLSTGSDMAEWAAASGAELAVYYHNITPSAFFARWAPGASANIDRARAQMRQLASRSKFAMANSSYSEGELVEAGFANTSVVPVLIDFADYDTAPSARRLERLERERADGGARWLFVGRVAPNKCQHDVIGAFAVYRELYDPHARLAIVGGKTAELYFRSLQLLVDELDAGGSVELTDTLSFGELLAYYRTADVFVCLSEHEGFKVPLLEAMHFGVPVVALASAAVPETVADAGLLLDKKDPVLVAAAVHRVLSDRGLHDDLVERGHRRTREFSLERSAGLLVDTVRRYTSDPSQR